jgi:queuosine precursor transporter
MNAQFLIELMQCTNPMVVKMGLFVFCMLSIILLIRYFGKSGLYVYCVIVTIIANIQVLRATNLDGFIHPIPLGNIVFTTLFLVVDILTELYGKKAAQKCVWLGFVSYLIFSVIMVITIGIKPVEITNPEYAAFQEAHNAMDLLFTPSIPLLISSITAYFISLYFDIFAFATLKKILGDQLLWLRSSISTIMGLIVDNIIFSLLAWVVFAIMPISLEVVLNTYIIGILQIRIILTIATIPVFYFIKNMVKKYKVSE